MSLRSIKGSKAVELRDAWSGPLTVEALAKRYRLAPITINKVWQRQREIGNLPADVPRPHFVVHSTPIIESDDDELIDFNVTDGKSGSNALLAALRTHHADIDFAEAHIATELQRLQRLWGQH